MMAPGNIVVPPAAMAELPPTSAVMADDSAAMAVVVDVRRTGSRVRARFNTPVAGSILAGDALVTQTRATLGDTLAHLPGISSTSFGPSASRPVLRGFQGERTRLLTDGIGSLDVSNTSPDHAVAINPLVADRIAVLRGASALLYASGAVGGVVNVIGSRIASRLSDAPLTGLIAAGYGSAADEYTVGGGINIRAADHLVVHVDGHYLSAGNAGISGFVLSPAQRSAALASSDSGVRQLAALRGELPSSDARTFEAAGGVAYIGDAGTLGFSVNYFNSVYGLPTRFSLDPATPQPNSRIDLDQLRFDLKGSIQPGGRLIDEIRFRFGYADYRHDEFLDTGPVTATFLNRAFDARGEIAVVPLGPVRSTLGGQIQHRDFRVLGAAPLLPPTDTDQFAGFSLYEIDLAPLRLEAGFRFEHTEISAVADPVLGNPPIQRSFNTASASLGANYRFASFLSVGLNLQYSERAPVVEELFTQGADPGTQGVLLGNPQLGTERSWGVEVVVRGYAGPFTFEGSGYYYRFPNFIFAGENGDVAGGLPVFQFFERRARYFGFEAKGSAEIARIGSWKLGADLLADYTNPALLGDGPVPRIPPLRLLGGLYGKGDAYDARIEVEWVNAQSRTGAFETPNRGYAMVNLVINARPLGADSRLSFHLVANNLNNADGRRAASFLKDFAPIAGRDIRLGARWKF